MQTTILDLRRRMLEVLRVLDRQERVTTLYRDKERAALVPSSAMPVIRTFRQSRACHRRPSQPTEPISDRLLGACRR